MPLADWPKWRSAFCQGPKHRVDIAAELFVMAGVSRILYSSCHLLPLLIVHPPDLSLCLSLETLDAIFLWGRVWVILPFRKLFVISGKKINISFWEQKEKRKRQFLTNHIEFFSFVILIEIMVFVIIQRFEDRWYYYIHLTNSPGFWVDDLAGSNVRTERKQRQMAPPRQWKIHQHEKQTKRIILLSHSNF